MSATISSEVYLPDGVTVARGATVTATLLGGWVADGDGTIRMIPQSFTVGEDGTATAVLEPGFYQFSLVSAWADRTRVETTYEIEDGATLTWGEVFGNPTIPPLTPSLVSQATEARDDAEAAQLAAEAARDAAVDISGISTSDDVVEALVKNTGGAGPKTSAALAATIAAQAPVLPGPLADVTSVLSAGEVIPLEVFDGYLWGFNGRDIHRSDDGATWTFISTVTTPTVGSPILEGLLKCDDGEVLAVYDKEIYRSTGWAGGSPTWAKVLDINGGTYSYVRRWGIDGDGTRFIVTEYGTPAPDGWTDSKYVWFSNDGGLTWTVVYDSPVDDPGEEANSHQHGVCIDRWADGRLWFVQGHGASRGVFWSDDDGATWTGVPEPDFVTPITTFDWPPTTLTATPHGLVLGSDSDAAGVYIIRRTADPADMKVEWVLELNSSVGGLNWFADRGFYDEGTGLVWLGYSARTVGLPPLAVVSDGLTAQIVWIGESGGPLGERVRSIVTYKGTAYMHLALAAGHRIAQGQVVRSVRPTLDVGRIWGGTQIDSNRSGVASGAGSKVGFRASAHGEGAEATGSSSVAQGWNAKATGDNSIAVGRGTLASAGGAIAHGQGSVASAQDAIAHGKGAEASSSGSVTLGGGAIATHPRTVALGQNTTTTGADQVQVGARHFEIGEITAPIAPGASKARVWVQDDGAGNSELMVRFSGENGQTIRRQGGMAVGAVLQFPEIAAGASADLTIGGLNCTLSDPVILGPPSNLPVGVIPTAFVTTSSTTAGVVTVRLHNVTAAPIDPPAGTYKVNIIK